MNHTLLVSALALSSLISLGASAAATVGQAAPEITLTDVDGKTVHLSDFKGKHVVLEWNNPNCPFVKKHYDTGNMQSLQKKNDSGDTVWLTINSASAQSREFMANDKLKAYIAAEKAAPTAYLTDSDTKVAREYGGGPADPVQPVAAEDLRTVLAAKPAERPNIVVE